MSEIDLKVPKVGPLDDEVFLSRSRSLQEIEAWLGVSDAWLRQEIIKGRLVARKFSDKMIRVLPSDMKDWLDRCMTRPRKTGPWRGRVRIIETAGAEKEAA